LIEAGMTHLVLMMTHPYPDGIVDELVEKVINRV
jgi:hypothetical protein